MPRTKEQNKIIREQKRQLIIDTALELFANEGYSHTSIAQIAKKAGISKGLLYNYFESKDGLLKAILQDSSQAIVHSGGFKKDMTPDDFMQALDYIFTQVEENKDFFKLYTALSTQPQVTHLLMDLSINFYGEEYDNITTFFKKYFGDKYLQEMLLMSTMSKGFSILSMYSDYQSALPMNLLKNTILDFYREKLKNLK